MSVKTVSGNGGLRQSRKPSSDSPSTFFLFLGEARSRLQTIP